MFLRAYVLENIIGTLSHSCRQGRICCTSNEPAGSARKSSGSLPIFSNHADQSDRSRITICRSWIGATSGLGSVVGNVNAAPPTVAAGGNFAGGLVGLNFGTVSNSYATGQVTGNNSPNVGGLVGNNESGGSI